MAIALAMIHDRDPREVIMEDIGQFLCDVQPLGTEVLLAVYIRPTQLKSGIYLPGNQGPQKEDQYQGKVGLVLAVGQAAFREDDTHHWGNLTPQVGDWVAVNVGDTWAFVLGNRHCRVVQDVDIKLVLQNPDIVY